MSKSGTTDSVIVLQQCYCVGWLVHAIPYHEIGQDLSNTMVSQSGFVCVL